MLKIKYFTDKKNKNEWLCELFPFKEIKDGGYGIKINLLFITNK